MTPQPPPGQDPIDPQGAFSPPPPPGGQRNYPPTPPPGIYPPMMMPYGMPPRRSWFKRILLGLLVTFLILSLFWNVQMAMMLGLLGDGSVQKTVLHKGEEQSKIAVLPIEGMITQASADGVQDCLKEIAADATVKALIVTVETPGGGVTASDLIYRRLKDYKKDHGNVKVVVSMGGMATSGGYYLSCAGDWIVAQPTTITGNIGVIMPRFNASKLADKWGIEDSTLSSPKGEYKDAGSWLRPTSDRDTAYFQGLIDAAFGQFKSAVVEGREGKLTEGIDKIANGKAYTAQEAKKLGLIDQIGYPDEAVAEAKKLAGLTNPMIVKYQRRSSFIEQLFGNASFRGSPGSASTVSINGVSVQLDSKLLDELNTPRLLYMWQGQ